MPETGSQPSFRPKKICKMIPNQKTGIEKPISTRIITARSPSEYWRMAEMIPAGIPTEQARRTANSIR